MATEEQRRERGWSRSLRKVVAEKDLPTNVSGQSCFHYIILTPTLEIDSANILAARSKQVHSPEAEDMQKSIMSKLYP